MAATSPASDTESLSQSTFLNHMTGTERAKRLLEQAICMMADSFVHLVGMRKPGVTRPCAKAELFLLPMTACILILCYQALEEEDDSDEEESEGPLHDEDTEIKEEEPAEMEEERQLSEDQISAEAASDTGSKSDSLTSTLTSPLLRSKLERHKGIKEAKSMLERVLPIFADCCTLLLKKDMEETRFKNFPLVPITCYGVLLICYKGLDDEDSDSDDSDEEESDIEQESDGEDIHSGRHELVEADEHKQFVENQTTTILGHKRCRIEDP